LDFATYTRDLYPTPDTLLAELPELARREGLPAIHIPDEVGRLLQILIVASRACRVLELGTLFGYSSIWIARALGADGRLVTLEADPKHAEVSRRNLARAGLSEKVEVVVGPALESLQSLAGEVFDLVFIDADKPSYISYLDFALRLSRPGTLIVADNTWRRGEVTATDGDESARTMAEFNSRVANESRLISTIVPTKDGADAVTVAVVR